MCFCRRRLASGCGAALTTRRSSACRQMASGTEGVRMARAKKTKPQGHLLRWCVSLIKGTSAKFIDYIEAPDAKTAEDITAKERNIPDTLRDRLVAIREDW